MTLPGRSGAEPNAGPDDPRSARRTTLLLVIGLLASHLWMHELFPNYSGPNALSRIYLTLAVVDDGTFRIDRWIERVADIQDKAEYDGHFYSDKAPGYSLLLVPVAALGRAFLPVPAFAPMAAWLKIVGLSLPVVAFWLGVRRYFAELAGSRRRGDAVVVAGAFGTAFFVYATQLFSHAMAGLLLFAAYRLLSGPSPGARTRSSSLRAAAAGAIAGLAFTVDYVVVLAVPVLLALAWATGERSSRETVWSAAGAAVPILAWMAYNVVCFDHPLRVGFHLHADPTYGEPYRRGFLGMQPPTWDALRLLTVSPARGLFFLSPVLVLAVPGLVRLLRAGRLWDALACAAVSLATLAFASTTVDPGGGWSVSSRYLVPAIPFLLALVAGFLEGGGRARTATFAGLALVGIVLVPVIAVTFPAFPLELSNPIHQLAVPLLYAGRFGPSPVASLLGDGAAAAIFLLVFAVAAASVLLLALREGGREGAAAAVVLGIALIALQASIPETPQQARWARIGVAYVEMLMGHREAPRPLGSDPRVP